MKAKVTMIESGSLHADKERRIYLKFDAVNQVLPALPFRESALGLPYVELDMELEVAVIEVAVRGMQDAGRAS